MVTLECYFFRSETLPKLSQDEQFPGELVGAWTTMFGRLDQAIHFWKYRGGFKSVMKPSSTSEKTRARQISRCFPAGS
ncbi:hypothetical protein OS493_021321 [Desmophyllum pertusum]|uniref:NIPSNAP domain-containing protein n=1 Tax=Desmophyllum pertusum TaxID=174260 RepID=A0A9W9ZBH8_9CNID|nr:hypothetical protein OS493_021321 [Desmophyllum pertusum]